MSVDFLCQSETNELHLVQIQKIVQAQFFRILEFYNFISLRRGLG